MKIVIGLIFMLALNTFLFLSQTAVTNIALEAGETSPLFFNKTGSFINNYDAGGYSISENVTDQLPNSGSNVQPSGGSFFPDMFVTFKNWLLDVTGLRYITAYVNAFPNFMKSLVPYGVPLEVAYAIGFLWHAMAFFLFILFLRGLV